MNSSLTKKKIEITGSNVTIDLIWEVATNENLEFVLSSSSQKKMDLSRDYLLERIDQPIYGVNTGFGAFSNVRIPNKNIKKLQKQLIRSHCCGVGKLLPVAEVRAVLFLRANTLARGYSGVRIEVVQCLLDFLNHRIYPAIPEQGSVGASGDLAPLAHLALSLMGEGSVLSQKTIDLFKEDSGSKVSDFKSYFTVRENHEWAFAPIEQVEKTEVVLKARNVSPLDLEFKEGLSLVNGCQVMTAIGALAAYKAKRVWEGMGLSGAMSLEALRGTRAAYHPLISQERLHYGEAQVSQSFLNFLGDNSAISESHIDCEKVQDSYSLRCIPAVHGAAKKALDSTIETLEAEANSSTDNPLVFAKEDKVLSCGNFHGQPVSLALDYLAMALTSLSSISERRISQLINPVMSNLPPFLIKEGGFNSGMMIVQVSAASLVSENKSLSHSASVDSIPTSVDKEDHVSMGTLASRQLRQVVENTSQVLAMELFCAAQALDFLKPLEPTNAVFESYCFIRRGVSFIEEDRNFSEDIQKINLNIKAGEFSCIYGLYATKK